MSLYKHILLAVDFSDTCQAIAEKAKALVALYDAELTLVHTIEPIPAYGYPGLADLESPVIESAEKEMGQLAKSLSIDSEHARIEFGSVKGQVLKVAEELNADLIIIGSHGRHGLSRLLGSSASGIVHGANCDVLTVRCQ